MTPFLLLFGVKKVLSCLSQPHLRPEELVAAQSPGAEPRASRDLLKSTFWAQSHENAAWFRVQVCIGSPECEKCCGFNSFARQELGGVFQHHYLVPLRECSSCLLSASKNAIPAPGVTFWGCFSPNPLAWFSAGLWGWLAAWAAVQEVSQSPGVAVPVTGSGLFPSPGLQSSSASSSRGFSRDVGAELSPPRLVWWDKALQISPQQISTAFPGFYSLHHPFKR